MSVFDTPKCQCGCNDPEFHKQRVMESVTAAQSRLAAQGTDDAGTIVGLWDHLQKMQVTNGSLTAEIDRLKAELEKVREYGINAEADVVEDRDLWKANCQSVMKEFDELRSKAKKLAEAIKALPLKLMTGQPPKEVEILREALAEFEKGILRWGNSLTARTKIRARIQRR